MKMEFLVKYESIPIQMKASFWFLICAFLQKGISVITTPIFTRIMTASEYGQYNVFNSWMSIITCFTTLNIYSGIFVQGLVKFENKRSVFVAAFQGLLFLLSSCWIMVYFFMHNKINSVMDITTKQGVLMLTIIWLNGVFQLWAQEQRVLLRYKILVIITLFYSVFTPMLGILLICISDDKVTAKILSVAIGAFISYFWQFIFHIRKAKCFYDREIWRYALSLSIPLIPHYLSQMILNSSDRIMIKSMVGTRAAGIYSLAYSISLIMTIFNTSLLSTIEPWVYQKIKKNNTDDLAKIAYPSFILIASVNLVLIMFAPEIVRIFAPHEYLEAIFVIPPITMSVYFQFMYSFYAMFEFYFEKTRYITLATFVGAAINIITNYIFIAAWGYMAAGYTTLGCYMIYAIMHYCFMLRICKKFLDGRKIYDIHIISIISLIFLGMGLIFLITYRFLLIRYGIIIGIIIVALFMRKKIKNLIEKFLIVSREKNERYN